MLNGECENGGMMIVKLTNWDKRTKPELQLQAMLNKIQGIGASIPEARIICFTPPAIMGLGMTGGATFMFCGPGGVNAQQLSTETKKLLREISSKPEALYATSSYNADTPQIFFDLDRDKAEKKIPSSIYLMAKAQIPAVLVECGFLSNAEESALLQTKQHQMKLAMAILSGYCLTEEVPK